MYKDKYCKVCKGYFRQYRSTQKVCSTGCAIKLAEVTRKRKELQEWNREKKRRKEEQMTITDWVLKVQEVFNTFIRLRDIGKTCVSCSTTLKGKYDAGHYHNANNHWAVRFDERNVWGQCVHCNRDLHANLIQYRKGLLERIGEEKLNELDELANTTRKYTIPELKELYQYYKSKVKECKTRLE